MNKMRLFAVTAVLLVGLSGSSYAQEPVSGDDVITGARALGMGGAQIAGVNDVTAVIHNPAALARIDKVQFQFGLDIAGNSMKTKLVSPTQNGSGSIDENNTSFGTFGVAYPVKTDRGSLVLALGINRVKDFNGAFKNEFFDDFAFQADNGEEWDGYVTEENIEKGGMKTISFAGAVDVSPNVSVGVSMDVWTGTYQIDKRFLRNNFEGADGIQNTGDEESWLDVTGGEDNISAISFKPSVLYFKDNFRFGAFLRFPMTFQIDQDNYEEYYTSDGSYFLNIHESSTPDSSDYYSANYEISAPMQVGMGLSFGRPGISSVAVDMIYENWKEAEDIDYPYYFSDKYRSSLSWRVGAEQNIPFLDIVGRIGYYTQPLNFKGPRVDDYSAPGIDIDNDKDYVTFGASKKFDDNLQLDIGYAHGFWRTKESNRQDEETDKRIYATITYQMPIF
ncbi:OmpP1/FadL family transporter [Candidatus Latescibacterota bacterium]